MFIMSTKAIEVLSDAIREYYGNYELEELCNQFNVDVDYLGVNLNHGKLANQLVSKNDYSHRSIAALQSPHFKHNLGKQRL
jgi:hypothetical protein